MKWKIPGIFISETNPINCKKDTLNQLSNTSLKDLPDFLLDLQLENFQLASILEYITKIESLIKCQLASKNDFDSIILLLKAYLDIDNTLFDDEKREMRSSYSAYASNLKSIALRLIGQQLIERLDYFVRVKNHGTPIKNFFITWLLVQNSFEKIKRTLHSELKLTDQPSILVERFRTELATLKVEIKQNQLPLLTGNTKGRRSYPPINITPIDFEVLDRYLVSYSRSIKVYSLESKRNPEYCIKIACKTLEYLNDKNWLLSSKDQFVSIIEVIFSSESKPVYLPYCLNWKEEMDCKQLNRLVDRWIRSFGIYTGRDKMADTFMKALGLDRRKEVNPSLIENMIKNGIQKKGIDDEIDFNQCFAQAGI